MEELLSTITDLCFDFRSLDQSLVSMSDFSPICQLLHTSPAGKEACQACSATAVDDCIRTKNTIMIKCHLGFIDAYVPLVNHERVVGILVCGQFLFEIPTDAFFSSLHQRLKSYNVFIPEDDLRKVLIPICPEVKFKAITALMSSFSTFLSIAEHRSKELTMEHSSNPLVRAKLYLENHYAEAPGIRKVARLCNISVSRLSHLFKEGMACSFTEYLNGLKLSRAKNLLANSDLPISEVALQVGFSTISHFNHLFRTRYGMSPSESRQHNTTRIQH
ncbi:MAG: helix-turn-helix domain-containing protein [Rectinemataceae bacterium]